MLTIVVDGTEYVPRAHQLRDWQRATRAEAAYDGLAAACRAAGHTVSVSQGPTGAVATMAHSGCPICGALLVQAQAVA